MVAASTTVGSFTSVLQPASVTKATPVTATRRIEKGMVRMSESSELDVEPGDEPTGGRGREDVGVEQLIDTRGRASHTEDLGVVTLIFGLPEPQVPAAERDRRAGKTRCAQQRLRHEERDAHLAQANVIGLLHVRILHVRDPDGRAVPLADVGTEPAQSFLRGI